jgi:hypothetical protein
MWDNVTEAAVIAVLRRINPNYVITFANGVVEDDIIVAVAPR